MATLISNAVSAAIAPLQAQVDRLEKGGSKMPYIESEPEAKADLRAVDPAAMDPFTRRLWEERTHDVPQNYGGDREPQYNIPLARYLKPDGTYAMLQGDAKNRLYYGQKGFHCLNDDENAEYEQKWAALILKEQREKAHLITAIRRLIDTDATLVGHRGDADADNELNGMSVPQLHQAWKSLVGETSQPDRALPPLKRYRSEGRDPHMAGIDTVPPHSRVAEFEGEMQQARARARRGRDVELTPQNWNTMR